MKFENNNKIKYVTITLSIICLIFTINNAYGKNSEKKYENYRKNIEEYILLCENNIENKEDVEKKQNIEKTEIPVIPISIEKAIENVSSSNSNADNEKNVHTIEGRVQQIPSLTLKECIAEAIKNNPEIKAAICNKDIYHTKIGQAWSNYFPEISVGVGYDRTKMLMPALSSIKMHPYNNYQTVNATISQLIYDFGKTKANVNISKKTYESSEQSLQETINTIVYNVKAAYYNLLFAIQQEAVLRNSCKIYELHLEQAKSFYEIGTKAKIDVITAEHTLSNVKLSHIKAKNLIDLSYAQLNNAMGLPEKTSYNVSDKLDSSFYDINFEKLIEKAYDLRPSLMAMEKKSEASGYLVKASKSAFLPDLKVSGSYNLGGRTLTNDYGYTFGGAFEYPVVNLMLLKKQVDEAKATHLKDKADLEVEKQNVYLDVKQAYINLYELQESIPVAQSALLQAKEQYELANGRYKVGLGDSIEFKDAENTYRNAQLDYYKTLLDYNTSASNLERTVGAPLETSGVPLL